MNVPIARPSLGVEEEQALNEVLRSGWISHGPKVEEFEARLAEYLGSARVCAVNSGTSAIMLALRAFGIGRGDSVVVPAYGCAATVLPVLETGARPCFADIDPYSYNLDWPSIEQALETDTRAVIVAHMFGQLASIEEIARECRARDLILIEDAALAFGARTAAQVAGTFGTAGCFSFHPRKMLTTGEGGAICTNDVRAAEQMASDRSYGAVQSAWKRFQTGDGTPRGFSRLAFNLKLTDLQGALGLVQLERLPEFITRRRAIAQQYQSALSQFRRLQLPATAASDPRHVFQSYVCAWHPEDLDIPKQQARDLAAAESGLSRFKTFLRTRGIAVSEAAQFLSELPVFEQAGASEKWPRAFIASRLTFALPMFPSMTGEEISAVIAVIEESLRREAGHQRDAAGGAAQV
jgi:dTDP-4-amino-4,6-dideoxygalactose transaminase